MSGPSLHTKRLTYFIKAAETTQRVATETILKRFGITHAQLAMLISVHYSPGASSAVLSRLHGITPQSSGEVIGQLVRLGLLCKVPSPATRRIHCIHLTDAGRALIEEANGALFALEARLTEGIDAQELAVTRKVLRAIVANGDVLPDQML